MLRAITTQLQAEIASNLGFATPLLANGAPRDVLWCSDAIALRKRMEQSSAISRGPELHCPFLSFYRTATSFSGPRMNVPAANRGVQYYRSGDGKQISKYKLIPVDLVYQVEFWGSEVQVENWETAIENYFKWAAPPSQLTLTDTNGVEFRLPMNFSAPEDATALQEEFDAGIIYHEVFRLLVMGYVVTEGGPFKTILSAQIDFWDATGEYGGETTADDILLKSVTVT